MNLTEKVIAVISDVLDLEPEELTAANGPENVEEWDSVNALRILTNIESELGVRISLEQFTKVKTIGELVDLVGVLSV